jgi:ABC-type glycerol-3-phosphate transport system permease component
MRNPNLPSVAMLSSRGGTRHRHLALVREAMETRDACEPRAFAADSHDIPLPWEEAFHPIPTWIVNVVLIVFGSTVVAVVVSRLAGWVTL